MNREKSTNGVSMNETQYKSFYEQEDSPVLRIQTSTKRILDIESRLDNLSVWLREMFGDVPVYSCDAKVPESISQVHSLEIAITKLEETTQYLCCLSRNI